MMRMPFGLESHVQGEDQHENPGSQISTFVLCVYYKMSLFLSTI